MIGYYNYTVILTYIGTVIGVAGIAQAWNGSLKTALICLMLAGVCDMFDGQVASTMDRTRREKRFGIQIDSLSDLICFGVLPASIVFQCSGGKPLHILIPAAYVLCALIRLAWFNVDEEERQETEETRREAYLGLPVTSAAVLLPLFIGGIELMGLPKETLCLWILSGIAIAFVTPFALKKPDRTGKAMLLLCGITGLTLVLLGVNA